MLHTIAVQLFGHLPVNLRRHDIHDTTDTLQLLSQTNVQDPSCVRTHELQHFSSSFHRAQLYDRLNANFLLHQNEHRHHADSLDRTHVPRHFLAHQSDIRRRDVLCFFFHLLLYIVVGIIFLYATIMIMSNGWMVDDGMVNMNGEMEREKIYK